jgi:hypothetical protein
MTAFSHTHHHDASCDTQHRLDGLDKAVPYARLEALYSFGLNIESFMRKIESPLSIENGRGIVVYGHSPIL